jgi:hypothetical protein
VPNASDSLTAELVAAVLLGGPASLPETERQQQVPVAESKIKIPHMGGYEHFHRQDESRSAGPGAGSSTGPSAGPQGPLIFNWAMRTKIAE